VNQLGYLPDGPKRATLISCSEAGVDFAVRDADGAALFVGRSAPWPVRPEPTSGLVVHVLDFSELRSRGSGLRVEAAGQRSYPFDVTDRLYDPLREDALHFFYLMRSGIAIAEQRAPGYARPAGHVGRLPNPGDTDVAAWTGPDADRLYPGWRQLGKFDVTGGWYDAGDYGKYVTSGAIAVWQLLGTLDLLARTRPSVATQRLAGAVIEECSWQLDWLTRMQIPNGHAMAGLAFHRVHGTEWSPLPGWPHEDPTERVLHRPSTTATLHLAAATAHGARLLSSRDQRFARRLLSAARRAYAAARRHSLLIPPDDHARFGGGPYADPDPADDFYWAAAELWLATGADVYRHDFLASREHTTEAFDPTGFDFDRVTALARIDLALAGAGLDDHAAVVDDVRRGADRLLELQGRQPWGQP